MLPRRRLFPRKIGAVHLDAEFNTQQLGRRSLSPAAGATCVRGSSRVAGHGRSREDADAMHTVVIGCCVSALVLGMDLLPASTP